MFDLLTPLEGKETVVEAGTPSTVFDLTVSRNIYIMHVANDMRS